MHRDDPPVGRLKCRPAARQGPEHCIGNGLAGVTNIAISDDNRGGYAVILGQCQQGRREIAAAISADLIVSKLAWRKHLVRGYNCVALDESNFVDTCDVAEIGDGSESKGDLVAHRAARIEDDIEHPGMSFAPGYHDIVAIVATTRGTRECPFAWRHAFEPGLERQLPGRAIDPAHRPDYLLRR